jgi:chemotaxis signal transduction protein
MAGFRGNIVPVYSLPMLLGYSAVESSRWLVLFGKDEMVGLAFDSFDGHLRIPEGYVAGGQAVAGMSRHIHEVTKIEGTIRPIIDLVSLYEGIKKCASSSMSGRSE